MLFISLSIFGIVGLFYRILEDYYLARNLITFLYVFDVG